MIGPIPQTMLNNDKLKKFRQLGQETNRTDKTDEDAAHTKKGSRQTIQTKRADKQDMKKKKIHNDQQCMQTNKTCAVHYNKTDMQASKTGSRTRQTDKQDWQTNRTRRQTDKRDKQDMQTEYTCRQTDKQDNRQVAQLGKTASPLKKQTKKAIRHGQLQLHCGILPLLVYFYRLGPRNLKDALRLSIKDQINQAPTSRGQASLQSSRTLVLIN